MEKCDFCGEAKNNKLSKSCHERLCKSNPNKAEHPRNNLGMPGRNQFSRLENPQRFLSEETKAKISKISSSQVVSAETRKKISETMKRYFEENPEKAFYRVNHYSLGPSYAEEYWKEVLLNAGLVFQAELPFGRFWLDFAFPELKIDLEIDGQQHYSSEEAIQRDRRRDEYLQSQGWKVIRVRWSEFKKLREEDKKQFISDILERLK